MTEHWTNVDGVPTVCAGGDVVPGPLRACLTFGSGTVDESLRNHGINHVVEHLAFHGSDGQSALVFNGWVDSMTTNFWVAGSADQVADFFEFITRRLADLPLDRLEDELSVLQIEASGHGNSVCGGDLEERFGPRGGGLMAWYELGLRTVDQDDLVAWSRGRFTASNAVLWCSGPLPRRLSLAALPAGGPVARTRCPDSRTRTRAFVPLLRPQVGVSFLSGPTWSAAPAVEALRQRAFDRLRAAALSYSVSTTTIRLDPTTRYFCVLADGVEGRLDQVIESLVGCVDEVASEGPTEVDVAKQLERRALARSTPDHHLSVLAHAARRQLFGLAPVTPRDAEARVDDLTPESLQIELQALLPTALAFGPEPRAGIPDGWTRHASWERDVLPGRRLEPIPGRERGRLIVGSRGVTVQLDDEHHRSVRWDEIEACIVDGTAHHLVDSSGAVVIVKPSNWRGGETLLPLVHANVDESLMIPVLRAVPHSSSQGRHADDCWLATITKVSAKRPRDLRAETVSVVIDTDGFFIVHDDETDPDDPARLEELRLAERETLLAQDARNRWIPRASVEVVELRRPVAVGVGGPRRRLRIHTSTGERLDLRLSVPMQVDDARAGLSRMLGRRFVERGRCPAGAGARGR